MKYARADIRADLLKLANFLREPNTTKEQAVDHLERLLYTYGADVLRFAASARVVHRDDADNLERLADEIEERLDTEIEGTEQA